MKIAIFTDSFLPQIDGVVTATLNLATGLADRGHKIYMIVPEYKNIKEYTHKNIRIRRISSIPALFYPGYKLTLPFSLEIFRWLRKEKVELIHFQTPITLGIQAIIISRILKVPLVGTFHTLFTDPQYLEHIRINGALTQLISWTYARAYYNQCDLITCPSESTKTELIKNGINKPIKVISNGIDFSIFNNSKWKQIKEKYNPDGKIILYVGRIAYEKNIFYLLDCFKLVLNKMPKTKLILVGGGPQEKKVNNKIRNMKISNSVIMMGKIEHNKLVNSGIFKACDLFVTASITENQPMTLLEAQTNGLPCVGINKRGVKDLIKNGDNGFLVNSKEEFAKRVIQILSNKDLYNKMRKSTLVKIKKHSTSEVIKTWQKVYKGIITGIKKPGEI
jgi:1,2-diacylglycerol 3-alpha-glucosyltransferase